MGVLLATIMGLLSFGLITVNALLFVLDYLVRELEYHYYLRKADSLIDYLDYLDAVISLNEIRQSPECRNLR
jgi:hypothetical protein